MNYVPIWCRLPKFNVGMENGEPLKISKETKTCNDTENADSSEHKLTVSATDTNLFEGQDRISVNDVPSDQRKKNTFYRWFKRKLWCIKRSKSADSNRARNPTVRKNVKSEQKQAAEEPKEVKLQKKTLQPVADLYGPEVGVQRPTPAKTPSESVKNAPVTPQVMPPKDRQVTFSDTVKTHIKTKYVTTEELQQIRGMTLNNRRMLYQYHQNPDVKAGDVSEIKIPAKVETRKIKQTNENKVT